MQERDLIESRQFSERFAELEKAGAIPEIFWDHLQHYILANTGGKPVIEGIPALRFVTMLVGGKVMRGKRVEPQRVRVVVLDLPKQKRTHLLAIFGKSEHTKLSELGKKRIRELVSEIKQAAR